MATAEDSQKLYALDGQYPSIASFELFERIRRGPLKHLYPTPGKYSFLPHISNLIPIGEKTFITQKLLIFTIYKRVEKTRTSGL